MIMAIFDHIYLLLMNSALKKEKKKHSHFTAKWFGVSLYVIKVNGKKYHIT